MMNGMKAFGAAAGLALLVSGCGSTGLGLFGGGADAAAVAAAAGAPTVAGGGAAFSSDPAVAAAQQKALSDAMTQQMVQRAITESFVPTTDAQLTSMQAAIRQAILNQALQQYRTGPVAVAPSPVPASVATASAPSIYAAAPSAPLVYIDETPAAVTTTYATAPATSYGVGGYGVSVNAPTLTIQ